MTFLYVEQIEFPSAPSTLSYRNLTKKIEPQSNFWKKTGQKSVFGHFSEYFEQKTAFFWRSRTLKTRVYTKKFQGRLAKTEFLKKCQYLPKVHFGSAGGRIPEEKNVHPAPPP